MGNENSTGLYETSKLNFCLFSRAGPNTGENLWGVDSKSSSSGTMEIEEREYPGKKGED